MLKGKKFDAFTLFDTLELEFQTLEHRFFWWFSEYRWGFNDFS